MADAIPPFAVEATNPRWSDLIVQGLTGVIDRRMRSRITPTTTTVQGNPRTKTLYDQSVPNVPGQVLEVHPAKCIVRVVDPLCENETAKQQLNAFRKNTRISNEPVSGVETREGKLDQDRMKTLCREVLHMLKAGEMELVKGVSFTLEDCDKLPGDYLLNPGALIPNSQPRYEKDLEEYTRKLNTIGG